MPDRPERKKTCVIVGAGIAGVSVAYLLAKDGWKVTILEKNPQGAARGMSFLNGGLLCPSLTMPWTNFSAVKLAMKAMFTESTVKVKPSALLDGYLWRWGAVFIRNILPSNVQANYTASYDLAEFSMGMMAAQPVVPASAYGRWAAGSLQTCTSQQTMDSIYSSIDKGIGQTRGCPVVALTKAECEAKEPILKKLNRTIVGGVFTESDSSGDIHQYTNAVLNVCQNAGVDIRLGKGGQVVSFQTAGSRVSSVTVASGETIKADDFVIAAGNGAERLAGMLGDTLLLYPIKGYVLEARRSVSEPPLKTNLVDDVNKVYVSPIHGSDKIRISGFAEFAGRMGAVSTEADPNRGLELLRKAEEFLPDGYLDYKLNTSGATKPNGDLIAHSGLIVHSCLRSQTPDDLPVIGPSPGKFENVWYNAGHGHIGWTRGVGSAHILAGLMRGQHDIEGIDHKPYLVDRFS